MSVFYRFDRAIVRTPPMSVTAGLRTEPGSDPDVELFRAQHAAYCSALDDAGVNLSVLSALESHPDSVFVEDTALCFPQFAVVLAPGAPTRQGEEVSVAEALGEHYEVLEWLSDGHVDGGDVLWTGDEVIIGVSSRTTPDGADALSQILRSQGLAPRIAATPAGVLHFKSDSSALAEGVILATHRLAASGVFSAYDVLVVPAGEELAANCIRVNDVVLLPAGFPQTTKMLEGRGYDVVAVENSEPARIDGGLSCMSLRLPQTN